MPCKIPVWKYSLVLMTVCAVAVAVTGLLASTEETSAVSRTVSQIDAQDEEIAGRFAPVFYQGLGEKQRHDYITNFDFDGNWRGDDNWANADNRRYPLKANVYYAVSETVTHIFIHYAIFHPRDYKGGEHGTLLSQIIREGAKHGGKYDPTGQLGDAVLAHENDMEGCLVVVEKNGSDLKQARVVFVETLSHDRFLKYVSEETPLSGFAKVSLVEGRHARLYVEPKGHGVEAFHGGENQRPRDRLLIYKYDRRADDPEQSRQIDEISYSLIPLYTTLWPRARRGVNETFGQAYDYGKLAVKIIQRDGRVGERQVKLGAIGSAFLGTVGARNVARPPWGWFDRDEPGQPLGLWFFDPASTIGRHFPRVSDFSSSYLHAPFLGVQRGTTITKTGER